MERPARGRRAPLGRAADDARAVDGVQASSNVEYGYSYQSAAVVPDGSASARAGRRTIRVYQPSHPPGFPPCRTPGSMTRTATAARSRTSLRQDGSCSSPAKTANHGVTRPGSSPRRSDLPLDAVRIGHLDGDLYDPRCTWLRHRPDRQRRRDLGPAGPVHRLAAPGGLDRPFPRLLLAAALSQVLAQPVASAI